MSVSVNRSIVEQFSFNGESVRSVYIENVGTYLVSRDVYRALGYDEESGKKQIQSLVPDRYKLAFRDVKLSIKQREVVQMSQTAHLTKKFFWLESKT